MNVFLLSPGRQATPSSSHGDDILGNGGSAAGSSEKKCSDAEQGPALHPFLWLLPKSR